MWYDANGIAHESWPGELSGRMGNNAQNQQGQRQNQQGQQLQQAQAFPRRTVDIIFVKTRDDVEKIKVNSGYDQVFMAEDDSFFAVKTAVGNGYTTSFYPLEPQKREITGIDTSAFVLKKDIPAIVSEAIIEMSRKRAQEERDDGTA